MENAQIADVFDEISAILQILGENAFRVRSYQNAARTVRDMADRAEDLLSSGEDLKKLPGIGSSIAEQIDEIVRSGTSHRLTELRGKLPRGFLELLRVRGLGPKKAKKLYDDLGIKSLDDLEQACKDHRIRDLPGMGVKTEEKFLENIGRARENVGRMLLRDADAVFEAFAEHIETVPGLQRFSAAGSRRRRRETIGDLDILLQVTDHDAAINRILTFPAISEVEAQGKEKLTLILNGNLNVDVRFFEADEFGAALLYFTGSKAHNIAVRKVAIDQGYKLNEYGLYKGDKRVAGNTEDEVYEVLGLDSIAPELRENRGEVEAAAKHALPILVDHNDIHGDFHSHTIETDGKQSIEEMAQAARMRGLDYLAITDHSQAVTIARGMDNKRVEKHAEAVRKVDAKLDDFWLLAGVEVDILKDGSLDIDTDILGELDWVIASIHSHFDLDEKEMTQRLLAAIETGVVDCIGHPFTRHLVTRGPISIDVDTVFQACRDNGVCLELNAQPERLDLPDVYCHRAKEIGVKVAIASDAHKATDLDYMRYGVSTARRGWLEPGDVLNSLSTKELRKRLVRKPGAQRWR
ncbi:MAG: hypothetical protein A2341_08690 [Deltaproteobacteria bacterium RIFOXYB12_FULL_58_9]|nr:MAG: hypothetical protein A2341_08690 [Deltaproteobacteria bacterium RIFOXYB12_FULL_58_9]